MSLIIWAAGVRARTCARPRAVRVATSSAFHPRVAAPRPALSQSSSVARGAYVYFSISAAYVTSPVIVDVTPLSGDPDLFVACSGNPTGDDSGSPSISNNIAKADAWGEDSITLTPNACGTLFYVAVLGSFGNATFTIVAAPQQGGSVVLIDGQPQSGLVPIGTTNLYNFSVPAGAIPNVTFSVTPSFGDPDLYITMDGSVPSPTNWNYRANSQFGSDSVVILGTATDGSCQHPPAAPCACADCLIRVAVVGFSTSFYTIMALSSAGMATLQEDRPVQGHADTGVYDFYVFNLLDADSPQVTFTVTSLSGDADLFVSMDKERPRREDISNTSIRVWWSMNVGPGDVVTIDNPAVGAYYVSVFGFTSATYTIVASAAEPSRNGSDIKQLVDGYPQLDSVAATAYAYYRFVVGPPPRFDIEITVAPSSGIVALYVNTCAVDDPTDMCSSRRPTATSATWTSDHSLARETITIAASDVRGCASCSYIIGVLGKTAAQFTVTASTSSDLVRLAENAPYRGQVNTGEYANFMFFVSSAESAGVAVQVTPFAGDPDLFVTACGTIGGLYDPTTCNSRPTNTSYTWRSANYGADSLYIPSYDVHACVPTASVPCVYFLSVLGYSASSFTILVSTRNDEPRILVDGVPQSGLVNRSAYDLYAFSFPFGRTHAELSLTSLFGDSDLFVLLNATEGEIPSPTLADYRSVSATGTDSVTIAPTDAAFLAKCGAASATNPCVFLIAVTGFVASEYQLVAVTDADPISFVPNVPVQFTVRAWSYAYFQFAYTENLAVIFSVTPISGDPDLVVSTSNNPLPVVGNATWTSAYDGPEVLEIFPQPLDSHACTAPCVYYVGVYAFGDVDCTFRLLARLKSAAPSELSPGRPSTGRVAAGEEDLYTLRVPAQPSYQHIDITVTMLSGDADLYVSLNGQAASPTNFEYRSTSGQGADYAIIHTYDWPWVTYCQGRDYCDVSIGVVGFTNATYSVVATPNSVGIQLQPNVPLYDHVGEGLYDFFFLDVSPREANATLTFAITPFAGDPDLYVSCVTPQPTWDSCQNASNKCWTSQGYGPASEVIVVTNADPNYCAPPAVYFLGVYGFQSNASFSILAREDQNGSVILIDGQPIMDVVDDFTTNAYTFVIPALQPGADVTLTPLVGDADLYVALNGQPASPLNFQYASYAQQGTDQVFLRYTDSILPTYCNIRQDCRIQVGVFGFTAALFTLVAQSTSNSLLIEGIPQQGGVLPGEYAYYVFEQVDPTVAVVFQLTATSGDPDLFVSNSFSSNITQPNVTASTWRREFVGGDVLEIYPTDANACAGPGPCKYYLGITAFGSAALYSILARTHNSRPTPLTLGRPLVDFVNATGRNFYVTDLLPGYSSLEIRVTPVYGDPDLFARLDSTPLTPFNAQYRSTRWSGDDVIEILRTDPFVQANCSVGTRPCTVTVLVSGFVDSQYSIVATSNGVTRQLQDGQPFQDFIPANSFEYFRFSVGEVVPVTITLTPFSGDPDLYVSVNNPKPGPGNFTWSSAGFGNETIVINPGDPNLAKCGSPCTFYIGVFAFGQNSGFTVTASTGLQVLLVGQPLSGHADTNAFAYFAFRTPPAQPGTTNPDVILTATPNRGTLSLYASNQVDPQTGSAILPVRVCDNPPFCNQYHVANYTWSSATSFGGEQIVIKADGSDPNYRAGALYVVGVLSTSNTTTGTDFSITYATSGQSITTLISGEPVEGAVSAGQYNYYRVAVSNDGEDVLVLLTPFSGDPDLYISVHSANPFPNVTNHDFYSMSIYNDSVYIRSNQLVECHPNTSTLEDVAVSSAAARRAAAVLDENARLPRGFFKPKRSFSTAVLDEHWNDIALPEPAHSAPSLARRMRAEQTADGSWVTSFLVRASELGSATSSAATVDSKGYTTHTGPRGLALGCGGARGRNLAFQACEVYISVRGFTSATYSLVANVNMSAPTLLVDGQPQAGVAASGSYAYYQALVSVPPGQQYSVFVVPRTGDPDLFVTTDGRPASRTSFDYQSSHITGEDVVHIGPTTGAYRPQATLNIAVYAFTDTEFTITYVSQDHVTRLADGGSQYGDVAAGQYVYYAIGVTDTTSTLTISLTVLGGDPDLYVAVETSDSTRPTNDPTTYQWAGNSFGEDVIRIPAAGSYCVTPGQACTFIIGVYGFIPSSYVISASLSNTTLVQLSDGVPSASSEDQGQFSYFVFQMPTFNRNLTISAVATRGEIDLYVTNSYFPGSAQSGSLPNMTNYVWSTANGTNAGGRDEILILSTDPNLRPADPFQLFTIGVYAVRGPADFALTATTTEAITALQIGVPTPRRSLGAGENQHFTVAISDFSADLIFALTTYSGNPAVLVASNGTIPSCPAGATASQACNAVWGTLGQDSDVLRIQAANPCANAVGPCSTIVNWGAGRFFISVFSAAPAEYTLTAFTTAVNRLVEGQPMNGVTATSHEMYFQFITSNDPTNPDVYITVSRLNSMGQISASGSPLVFYVVSCLANACSQADRRPGPTNNEATQYVVGETADLIISSVDGPLYCQSGGTTCGYYIGVYPVCSDPTSDCETNFQITVKVQNGAATTSIPFGSLNGVVNVQTGAIPTGSAAEFELFLQPQSGPTSVRLNLEACSPAFPALFVCDPSPPANQAPCKNPFAPSLQDHTYAAQTSAGSVPGTGVIQVPNSLSKSLYVGVNAPPAASSSDPPVRFVFSASANNALYLAAPASLGLTVSESKGLSVTVSWNGAVVTLPDGSNPVPAKGVVYTVYASANGFGANVLATTPCGLDQWTSTAPLVPTVDTTATSAVVSGLQPGTNYTFNVVARCDDACWATNLADLHRAGRRTTETHRGRRAQNGPATQATQRVAYAPVAAESGSVPPSDESKALSGGIIAIISIGAILVVGSLIAYWIYRRRQAQDFVSQYDYHEGLDAMDTLPQPSSHYAKIALADEDGADEGTLDDRVRLYTG